MPGPKSRSRSLEWALLLFVLLVMDGRGLAPQARGGKPAGRPQPSAQTAKPPASQVLGSDATFLGWRAESPIFRNEHYLESGQVRKTYYELGLDARVTRLASAPPVQELPRGSVLVSDFSPVLSATPVVFRLDADPAEVRALEEALGEWWQRGDGKPQAFPSIHATLRILLGDPARQVWQSKRILTVTFGEAGYQYQPPKLRFAALSPSGGTLLVELIGGQEPEFVPVALSR